MLGHLCLEQMALASDLKTEYLKLYEKHLRKLGKTDEGIFKAKLKLLKLVADADWAKIE